MRLPVLNRSAAMLLVALFAGLFAVWAARQYIQGRIHQIEVDAVVPTTERIVAAYDLPQGIRLSEDHIAIRRFPVTMASSDSLAPGRFTELTGNVLMTPLRAGDPILTVHTMVARNAAFSSRLGQGRRAITIPVDSINSVSGLLAPGDLIDLYVSFEYQRRRITAPLLQGVLVLATGTATQYAGDHNQSSPSAYSTVTLDAAPEDAVKLVAARQGGSITALLRHPHDSQPTQKAVRGDLASLLGVNAKPVPDIAKRATVIYGNQSARRLPSLSPSAGAPRQESGVFDLPYAPELVSAWMHSMQSSAASDSSLLPTEQDGRE